MHDIQIKGVPGVDVVHMNGGTSNLQAGEIFKIRAGKIHEIEAMGVSLPYGTKSPGNRLVHRTRAGSPTP